MGIVASTTPACELFYPLEDIPGASEPFEDAAEAGAATGDGVAAAQVPFRCADQKNAVFCADFDSDPFDRGWDEHDVSLGGMIEAAPAHSSRGMKASTPARASGAQRPSAELANTVPMPTGTAFTYSFDVFFGSLAGTGAVDFGGFAFRGPYYVANLRLYENGTCDLQEYADTTATLPTFSRTTALARCPAGESWTRVGIRVVFAPTGAASAATVTFGGDVVLDNAPIEAWRYVTSLHFIAGAKPFGSGAALSIIVDDVIVTAP